MDRFNLKESDFAWHPSYGLYINDGIGDREDEPSHGGSQSYRTFLCNHCGGIMREEAKVDPTMVRFCGGCRQLVCRNESCKECVPLERKVALARRAAGRPETGTEVAPPPPLAIYQAGTEEERPKRRPKIDFVI